MNIEAAPLAELPLVPEMAALKTRLEARQWDFADLGYEIEVRPSGVATWGGWRGVTLTAKSPMTGDVHTVSIESGTDVRHHVSLKVDDCPPPFAPTMFPMPADLGEIGDLAIRYLLEHLT